MAYVKLLNAGKIPIFIEGYKVKSPSFIDFQHLLTECFCQQYSPDLEVDFQQENKQNIYLLIDDWDKISVKNQKAKGKLLQNIIANYENVVFTGNELIQIEEILSDEETTGSLYTSFKQYELLEFNHTKRSSLIHKWYTLGSDDLSDENEILRKCDNAKKAIEVAMGQKIVPNYPIFLLILLQTLESANPHNLQISSYSNYYQLLILKSLTDRIKDTNELTLYQNYASELAHFFFTNHTRILTEFEFRTFHSNITSYEMLDLPELSWEKALNTLIDVGIIERYNESIEFKYQYVYYFFEAKFLSQNIGKDSIKLLISDICKKLYRTEHANIIMFLIQFSSDDFILTELTQNAKEIFADLIPCELENDIQQLQDLVEELPKIYLKNKSVKDIRSEEDKKLDQLEEEKLKENELNQKDITEDETEISIISRINLSFKLIEILGQVLKNTHGVMVGPTKHEMLKDVYLLGLRTLKLFFSIFEGNSDFMLNQLKEALSRFKKIEEDKIEKIARDMLFSMCSHISYVFLKKISDSISSNKFIDKYPKIEEQLNYSSVKIINFLIYLDVNTGFPDRELTKIKEHIEKYPVSYFTLKRVVLNYLHRHQVNYKDKQRICAILGIDVERQLVLQGQNKEFNKS